MKSVELGDLFTDDEIAKAKQIINTDPLPNKRLVDEVVTPAMKHINEVTGQENDARYFAYALERYLAREASDVPVSGPRH